MDLDFALIDRFLAGECSPAEAELVRRWLATHPEAARYADAVRDVLARNEAPPPATAKETGAAWAQLARDTVDPERNTDRLPPPIRLTMRRGPERGRLVRLAASPWLRAAAIVLAIGGGAWWATRSPSAPLASAVSTPTIREYATARGQRTELRLPDGTRVLLAPESRVGVPSDFGVGRRELTLEGQAFFEVTHDERKPFRVRAGDAVASDLGTQFVVRAYPPSRAVQAVVVEGKVQFAAAGAPAGTGPVLVRGDLARLDSTGVVTTARTNVAAALAWTRGELIFDDASLAEVAAELGRWYDLDIRLADSALRRKRLTLTLRTESVPEALDAVAVLAGARYRIQGRTITYSAPLSAP